MIVKLYGAVSEAEFVQVTTTGRLAITINSLGTNRGNAMTPTHRAIISWIPAEDGGRLHPPTGPRYAGVVRFEEDEKWPREVWSFIVDFEKQFGNRRIILAAVRYLFPDTAPNSLLHSGSRFELLEGHKRVAKGVVLPLTVRVPNEVNEFEAALIG